MSRLFVRRLSTFPALAAPGPSTATAPLAVRRRRAEQPGAQRPSALLTPEPFASGEELFHPKLEDLFQTLRAEGKYRGEEAAARAAFLETNAAWRSRVRGGHGRAEIASGDKSVGSTNADTKLEFFAREGAPRDREAGQQWRDTIVGTKIWLPNIQIRLMRNTTAPGEAYDPTYATFRIPNGMTKNDLRSYLSAVYGLDVTYIRTDNYIAPVHRIAGGRIARIKGSKKNYKRAIVGLKEPFHYPDDVDELRAGTFGGVEEGERLAKQRESVLQAEYAITEVETYRKTQRMKMFKSYRWRAGTHDNAGNTVREIMRRRAEREALIADKAAELAKPAASESVPAQA